MNHHSLLQAQIRQHLKHDVVSSNITPLIEAVSDSSAEEEHKQNHRDKSLSEQNVALSKRNVDLHSQLVALQESYSILQTSLSSTYDALVMLDLKGDIRLSNPNFNRMFGMTAANAGLSDLQDFLSHCESVVVDNHAFANAMRDSLSRPESEINCELHTLDGRWIEAHPKAHWHDNDLVGQVWSFRDITALKLKEREAQHRTNHDLLTGLPNRRSLLSRLKQQVDTHQDSSNDLLVLFLDLGGFKEINDSLGHSVGDSLLIEVAQRIDTALPPNSTLTRHGGDEFVALLTKQVDAQQAPMFAEKIFECFKRPFHIGSQDIYMSVSIGIASLKMHGNEDDRLVNYANLAMTHAKKQGKNTYQLYDTATSSHCEHRLRIKQEINVALEQDQFELFFQPKICLESGTIKGAEALIRWKKEDGTFRNPMEFIPIAEDSGQIIPISQWLIRKCCEHLNDWMAYLDSDFVLALNISAKHFQKGLLQEHVAEVLKEVKTIPSMLELEVTETAIMDDIELAVSTLNELKKLGIRTAIDDFGTGHSSLNYLRKLPIEVLKIDKSFIDGILVSNEDRTLVKGIIDMVHALGIEVVAEGVENHQMAVLLQNMDCDLVQGYHYCKPVSETNFIALIKENLCYI